MRYFRARQYIHASLDGLKTLCGLQCNTFGCHWESMLWEEVTKDDYLHRPCPKCQAKVQRISSEQGQQTNLNVFQ